MLNPFNSGYYTSKELRKFGFLSVGENVLIAKNCTIIGLENISIDSNVRVDGGVTFAAKKGFLEIGKNVHIGGGCHFSCSGGIRLLDFSGISQGGKIYSVSDDYSGKSMTNPTLPEKYLNEPWETDHKLPYPKPIIDYSYSRQRALEKYERIK